jgi:hypothetical protein
MKLRNTLILFVILIGLGSYVYLVEVKQHQKTEAAEQTSKKLFTVVKDSIDTITFTNPHGTFRLDKNAAEWKISEPVETEADASTVNSMLTSLVNATKESEFVVTPAELINYGLGPRAIQVQLNSSDGQKDSLWLGEKTPVGSSVFCSKTDTMVYTINQSVKTNFEKKLYDIRDKKILHFKRADVRRIILNNGHGQYEFEKSGASDWLFKNINRPADNGKINSLLSKLENNSAKEFVDEEGSGLKTYGLTKPAFQVSLILGPEQGQKKLEISRKLNGKYYAKDETRRPIFEIDSIIVKDVNQKLTDFRGKDLATFNRSAIDSITFGYGDTLFSCVKDTSNNWFLDDTSHQAVKSQKINSFFSGLDYTTISEFVKDGSYNPGLYGLNNPALEVTLYQQHKPILTVKLGKKKGKEVYATTDQYESVYLIPESKLKDFKLKPDDIIEKPVSSAEEVAQSS